MPARTSSLPLSRCPSVLPASPPSVIPDVFNRESILLFLYSGCPTPRGVHRRYSSVCAPGLICHKLQSTASRSSCMCGSVDGEVQAFSPSCCRGAADV